MHCCSEMDTFLASEELPVIEIPKFREIGIVYADGTSSFQQIAFCPWCGKRLPPSLRDEWFRRVEALGFEIGDTEIPVEYQSDAWFRQDPARPAGGTAQSPG